MKIEKILIHCLNSSIADILERNLDRNGNIVIKAETIDEVKRLLVKEQIDAVIIEYNGKKDEFLDILAVIEELSEKPVSILIEKGMDRENVLDIMKHGSSYVMENLMELHSIDRIIGSLIEDRDRNSRRSDLKDPAVIVERLKDSIDLKLSRRELEILFHFIQGKRNREISKELGISEKTVKNHMWKIYRKFGVDNRTQLFNVLIKRCGCMNLVNEFSLV
ncbi:MAG: hypothetical protein B6D63_00250 [Candidatus Latescibacteria bacterium 4484_7]|nr:MAG: hypothetical protein B6D63_00250 [Candidatus Latescibacteria bacterium 4484_7]